MNENLSLPSPINDAPTIANIVSQFIEEDTTLELQIDASDVDGDDTFELAESEYYSFFDDNMLSLTSSNNFTGQLNIQLFASDNELTTSTEFELNIIGVNDAQLLLKLMRKL